MAIIVPRWNQLREHDHKLLKDRGYGNPWFDTMSDKIRLTVLTLYVKMSGIKGLNPKKSLWQDFVLKKSTIYPGRLEFLTDTVKLKAFLTRSTDFSTPSASLTEWDSVEKRYTGSLHFKHPLDKRWPWPINKVQAHIDKVGWRGFPPVSIVHHGLTYSSYKDPFISRNILLDQGWDPVPLGGTRRNIRSGPP